MHSSTEIIIPLVNEKDEIIGSGEKLQVHQLGLLHRAFSVLIFDDKGRLLLQQRASVKYHSPSLWTNSCCGHPNIGEDMQTAAERRLQEEMGFTVPLEYLFTFKYKASFTNGLTEHEIDHVYKGIYSGAFTPNPEEVDAIEWVDLEHLQSEIKNKPENFTVWFKELFPILLEHHPNELS